MYKEKRFGVGISSVVESLPIMHDALDLIPSIVKTNTENKKGGVFVLFCFYKRFI